MPEIKSCRELRPPLEPRFFSHSGIRVQTGNGFTREDHARVHTGSESYRKWRRLEAARARPLSKPEVADMPRARAWTTNSLPGCAGVCVYTRARVPLLLRLDVNRKSGLGTNEAPEAKGGKGRVRGKRRQWQIPGQRQTVRGKGKEVRQKFGVRRPERERMVTKAKDSGLGEGGFEAAGRRAEVEKGRV